MSAVFPDTIIWLMKISELGEFGLIDLLAGILPQAGADQRLLLGVGDDAAAWQCEGPGVLATTDALVEGVHFRPDSPWWELGWKALSVNLSDIAAMGGVPQYALVNLSLPADTEVERVAQLYRGLSDLARRHQVLVPGGNVTSAPVAMVAVTVIGRALEDGMLLRSTARPGDLVAVTGSLGMAAGGLKAWGAAHISPEAGTVLRKAYLMPEPRVREGQELLRHGVRTAIDISDGLLADLGHVCRASGVGATIRVADVPVDPRLREAFGREAVNLALAGGEDYELLFTAGEETVRRTGSSLGPRCPVTVIGQITRETSTILLGEDGRPYHIEGRGWDHFSGRGLQIGTTDAGTGKA